MGRPRVNARLPAYASEFLDRHGRPRIRLRRTGFKTVYVTEKPGTAAFTEAYHAWLSGGTIEPRASNIIPGSFSDLIERYYASLFWANIPRDTTRYVYRNIIERFRDTYGDRQVDGMTAKHMMNLMSKMSDRPAAANNLRKRLKALFDFAIISGFRKDNPALVVRGFAASKQGYPTWQEPQIEAFEAAHPLGTMQRLAFDLFLYTAQRRSDVAAMGPSHESAERIKVRQLKTNKLMLIPIHPRLRASLDATQTGQVTYLVNAYARPFTVESLGNWFRKACDAAGLTGFSAHGLRKASSRRMAEIGLSNQLIKSMTGHETDSEVARYTKEAEQITMADRAMAQIVEHDLANPRIPVSQINEEVSENA